MRRVGTSGGRSRFPRSSLFVSHTSSRFLSVRLCSAPFPTTPPHTASVLVRTLGRHHAPPPEALGDERFGFWQLLRPGLFPTPPPHLRRRAPQWPAPVGTSDTLSPAAAAGARVRGQVVGRGGTRSPCLLDPLSPLRLTVPPARPPGCPLPVPSLADKHASVCVGAPLCPGSRHAANRRPRTAIRARGVGAQSAAVGASLRPQIAGPGVRALCAGGGRGAWWCGRVAR